MRTTFLFLLLSVLTANAAFTEFYIQSGGGLTNSGHTTNAPTIARQAGTWDGTTLAAQLLGVYTFGAAVDLSGVQTNVDWASVYVDGATESAYVGRIMGVDDANDRITNSILFMLADTPIVANGVGNRSIVIGGPFPFPTGAVTGDPPFDMWRTTSINYASNPPCVNIRSNTYTLTAGLSAVAFSGRVQGYHQVPHDGGRPNIIVPVGTSFAMLTTSGSTEYYDLVFDGRNFNAGTSVGISGTTRNSFCRVTVRGSRTTGFNAASATGMSFTECEAFGNLTVGFNIGASAAINNCISYSNGTAGFLLGGADVNVAVNCISYHNGGHGFNNSSALGTYLLLGCDSYANTSNGFTIIASQGEHWRMINCNSVNNRGYGFAGNPLPNYTGELVNCGFGTGTMTNTLGNFDNIVLTSFQTNDLLFWPPNLTPWTDPDRGNFRIHLPQASSSGRGNFTQSLLNSPTNSLAFPVVGAVQSPVGSGAGSFTFAQ